jgi:ATP-dependent Zn protease
MNTIEKYFELTKQEPVEVFAGESQYGASYVNNLIEKALNENKKIVFIPELTDGEDLGLGKYELQSL